MRLERRIEEEGFGHSFEALLTDEERAVRARYESLWIGSAETWSDFIDALARDAGVAVHEGDDPRELLCRRRRGEGPFSERELDRISSDLSDRSFLRSGLAPPDFEPPSNTLAPGEAVAFAHAFRAELVRGLKRVFPSLALLDDAAVWEEARLFADHGWGRTERDFLARGWIRRTLPLPDLGPRPGWLEETTDVAPLVARLVAPYDPEHWRVPLYAHHTREELERAFAEDIEAVTWFEFWGGAGHSVTRL